MQSAEVQPPGAASVRCGVEDPFAREDLEARDLDVRQPRRGVRPGRGACCEAQGPEVRPGIQVAGNVVTDEVVYRQVTEVVRAVDPRRRPRPRVVRNLRSEEHTSE